STRSGYVVGRLRCFYATEVCVFLLQLFFRRKRQTCKVGQCANTFGVNTEGSEHALVIGWVGLQIFHKTLQLLPLKLANGFAWRLFDRWYRHFLHFLIRFCINARSAAVVTSLLAANR